MERKQLYLLQKYDNGDFYVYHWTPSLAAKGYNVLEPEAAQEYLDLQIEGKNNISYLKESSTFQEFKDTNEKSGWVDPEEIDIEDLEEFDDGEDSGIIDKIGDTVVREEDTEEDETIDIDISQEDILAKELKYVKGLSHKSSVEKHLLEKYQVEIPVGTLSAMKALANQMLTDLSNKDRLYLVDKGVKLP